MPIIFIIGATGYIGGTVLVTLQKTFPDYTFKALARTPSSLSSFPKPVEPVQGTFADTALITQHASQADVVVAAGDSDDVALKDAVLGGLKQRYEAGKGLGALVWTSGTAVYWDGGKEGKYDPKGKVWTDDEEDVRAINEKMVHGPVDISILKAQQEGYFNAYILAPAIVHGTSSAPTKRSSIFFKYVVGNALAAQRVAYIGEGSNITGAVYVNDLAALFTLVVKKLAAAGGKRLPESPYTRYVIACAEPRLAFKDVVSWIGAELHGRGKIPRAEPLRLKVEDAGPVLGFIGAANTLVEPKRAKELGWVPSGPTLRETVSEDVEALLGSV